MVKNNTFKAKYPISTIFIKCQQIATVDLNSASIHSSYSIIL